MENPGKAIWGHRLAPVSETHLGGEEEQNPQTGNVNHPVREKPGNRHWCRNPLTGPLFRLAEAKPINQPNWSQDPWRTQERRFGGTPHPLGAHFNAPLCAKQ